ncbi:MAG TPA: YafY family protein [Methylomirabilota bacterium]|jgi:predicted DNA-binding transcriptional regulator YafY|nr:YafY family protein [Methylomirabilota bacterium]
MNRVDRLMAIALRLQSRRLVRAEDIATHFEISVRTVYRDMAALCEAGIPILAEAGVGYSLVKGYHLPPVMFTGEEASALSIGGKLVEHLTDASLRKQMDSALLKIRSVLPRDRQDYLDRLERSTTVISRGTDAIPRLRSEALIPVQRALAERRVLALDYQAGQAREVTRREVEPLGLVYYSDNWHLIAYCRLRRDVRDFRTDRILKLQLQTEVFTDHVDFSLKGYLEAERHAGRHAGKFEMARIRFRPEVIERVRRERFWGLIEETPDEDGYAVTLLDCSLEWLAGWVLSFGSKAEVIAPKALKEIVSGEADKIAAKYSFIRPSPVLSTRGSMPTKHAHSAIRFSKVS